MFNSDGRTELGQSVDNFNAPDLTPEEMTEHYGNVIARALEGTGLIEVREVQANLVNQVHIMARVKEKNARVVAQKVISALLQRTEPTDIECFCGKQYLWVEGRLVYAWVFGFGSPDIKRMAQIVCDTIEVAVPPKRVEVLEAPLMGPGTPQSSGPGSRGAAPVRG